MTTKRIIFCALFLFLSIVAKSQFNMIGLDKDRIFEEMEKSKFPIDEDIEFNAGNTKRMLGFKAYKKDYKDIALAFLMDENDICWKSIVIYSVSDIDKVIQDFGFLEILGWMRVDDFTWLNADMTYKYKIMLNLYPKSPDNTEDRYCPVVIEKL